MSLRESLEKKPPKEKYFSQKAMANNEMQTKIMEQLDPPNMTPRVDMINENYDISINVVNTRETLTRNLLVINYGLPSQQLLLS